MSSLADYLDMWRLISSSEGTPPWELIKNIESTLSEKIDTIGEDYTVTNHVAIHKSAVVEQHVVLKGPIVISANCFIGAHAYLRGGVYLGEHVSVGPGCEIKSSYVLNNATLAHFNFVGDSIIGSYVNLEAGAIMANHFNEREDKTIHVVIEGKPFPIATTKFGGLVGDHSKIGANAVLSPGTLLSKNSIVKRLALIDQMLSASN